MYHRREFLGTAFTTPVLTGNLKGANDRVAAAFIGMGGMGRANLKFAMTQPGLEVVAVCDVKQPELERAVAQAAAGGRQPRAVKDFREVLADKSIDVVCIAAPDHWHAYMTVEACKAGKDVYVEKPVCTVVDEGPKMVEAARKYQRVVQAGTMQRSGDHFQKAVEIVKSGRLGKVTFVRTFNYYNSARQAGSPPDGDPPPGIDWDLWLGPAPSHAYNPARAGNTFRKFWDYAGGMMTDYGVHWLDIVQMAMDEAMPAEITAIGGRLWVEDNGETPDAINATFKYPGGTIAVYETRAANGQSLFEKRDGIVFHGSRGTLALDRQGFRIIPEKNADLEAAEVKNANDSNAAHWADFLECVRTRQRPISDVEKCYRATATCLLGNVAYRSQTHLHWDAAAWSTREEAPRKLLTREYRAPWKLVV